MGKKAARARRKAKIAAQRATIKELDDAELRSMRHELGRLSETKRREINELQTRIDIIKREQQARETSTSTGLNITDHAIVRYLERIKGVDINAIREEIDKIAQTSKQMREGRKGIAQNGDIAIGLNDIDGTVTTFYSKQELTVADVEAE